MRLELLNRRYGASSLGIPVGRKRVRSGSREVGGSRLKHGSGC